ncbi:MAG: ABC transporter substrate-binding protein [Chitinophagaceae bacterium]|nr:ABC transporter substrate-binding protein [Chitinophagaceae bacterium]
MILQKPTDLGYIPKRIISVVPSQTELLSALGLERETAGITKFCIHPASWFKTKKRIGGTKNLQIEAIRNLQPDLVIANKEENVREQIEQLALDHPVWVTDVNNLEDATNMIHDIGVLTGTGDMALSLTGQIKTAFDGLPKKRSRVRTAYLIWRNPYMTAGGDTFIHDMMQHCGFENIFAHKTRYPETSVADLQTGDCQLLLLSSEPYPFKQKHINELKSLLPNTAIILVNGEYFSWYGSRLLKAPAYFKTLINEL